MTADEQAQLRTERVTLEITNERGFFPQDIALQLALDGLHAKGLHVRVVSDEEREAELASLRDANDKLWRDKCSLIEKLRPLNEAIPPMFDSNGDRLPSLGALHQLIAEREAAVVRVAKLEEQAERVDAAVGATAEKFVNGHNALKARVEKLEKQHVDAEMLRHALAKSEIERLKAIRARDEAAEFWKGELRSRTAERDAAIRERESWKLLADRTNERLSAAEARVAELEAASGGGEKKPMRMPSREWFARMVDVDEANISVGGLASRVAEVEAASGGGEGEPYMVTASGIPLYRAPPQPRGGDPVAWMCEWTDHTSLHRLKTDAEDEAHGTVVPQPLYRSPPQPRGWLTEEEREALEAARVRFDFVYLTQLRDTIESLVARSTPPKVRLVRHLNLFDHHGDRADAFDAVEVFAALAAAGVEVEEVGGE